MGEWCPPRGPRPGAPTAPGWPHRRGWRCGRGDGVDPDSERGQLRGESAAVVLQRRLRRRVVQERRGGRGYRGRGDVHDRSRTPSPHPRGQQCVQPHRRQEVQIQGVPPYLVRNGQGAGIRAGPARIVDQDVHPAEHVPRGRGERPRSRRRPHVGGDEGGSLRRGALRRPRGGEHRGARREESAYHGRADSARATRHHGALPSEFLCGRIGFDHSHASRSPLEFPVLDEKTDEPRGCGNSRCAARRAVFTVWAGDRARQRRILSGRYRKFLCGASGQLQHRLAVRAAGQQGVGRRPEPRPIAPPGDARIQGAVGDPGGQPGQVRAEAGAREQEERSDGPVVPPSDRRRYASTRCGPPTRSITPSTGSRRSAGPETTSVAPSARRLAPCASGSPVDATTCAPPRRASWTA